MKDLLIYVKDYVMYLLLKAAMAVAIRSARRHPEEAIWYRVEFGSAFLGIYKLDEKTLSPLKRKTVERYRKYVLECEMELSMISRSATYEYKEMCRW